MQVDTKDMCRVEIEKIQNTKTKDIVMEFICNELIPKGIVKSNKQSRSKLKGFLKAMEHVNIDKLNWNGLSQLCLDNYNRDYNHTYTTILRCFIGFIVEHEYYKYGELEYLKTLMPYMEEKAVPHTKLVEIFDANRYLSSMVCVKSPRHGYTVVNFNTSNDFIIKLLKDYIETFYTKTHIHFDLLNNFSKSYNKIESFKSICDFDYESFKHQFEFFDSYDSYSRNRDKLDALNHLKNIYLYMISKCGEKSIFKVCDPIDKVVLERRDFTEKYRAGFEVVRYNPFEETPSVDKWFVAPNGYEKKSTKLKYNTYSAFDFSKVENTIYRRLAKDFIWKNNTNNLSTLSKDWSYYVIALNFLSEYKLKAISLSDKDVDFANVESVDILSFRQHVFGTSKTNSNVNNYLKSMRSIVKFGIDNNFLEAKDDVFDYLTLVEKTKGSGGKSISDDDLVKFENHLVKIMYENHVNYLYFIIFNLCLLTEFRIAQILSLKIGDIEEGMKKGQFFINSTTKVSGGEVQQQAISQYTKRYLDNAITFTQELRESCKESKLKEYIFLNEGRSEVKRKEGIYTIRTQAFRVFCARECRKIEIPSFTPANLRDTHMTKAAEFVFKNALSDLHYRTLTSHSSSKITNEHYVDPNIRTFVEATVGVVIGNVDIKGQIIPDKDIHYSDEKTVSDGCGYCDEDICKMYNGLDCLMCSGIRVTVDRIPFFVRRIKKIDELIEKQSITHEKEHLVTIKRLHAAYLEKLYALKEDL